MSQITTCPSCGTRFRVVADQLRISDGWVRCGQCQEVFDARNHLDAAQEAEHVEVPVEAHAPAPASELVPAPAAPATSSLGAADPESGAENALAAPDTDAAAGRMVRIPLPPMRDMPSFGGMPPAPAVAPVAAPVPVPPVPAPEPDPVPPPGYELPVPQWSDDLDLSEYHPAPEPVVPAVQEPELPSHDALESGSDFSEKEALLPPAVPASPIAAPAKPVWNANAAPRTATPPDFPALDPSLLETGAPVQPAAADAQAGSAWAGAPEITSQNGLQGAQEALSQLSESERVQSSTVGAAAESDGTDMASPSTLDREPVPHAEVAEDAGPATVPLDAIESAAQKLAQAEPWPTAGAASAAAPAFPFAASAGDDDPLALDSSLEPGFVRDARRKAWWQKPLVRVAMGAGVVVLPVALVLQVALHERNALVAWQPGLRPALEFMCTALQCKLGPRQQIAAMVVSGSAFAKGERDRSYQLSLSIQNRARTPVGMPAVELTLTDAQDQAIARKVISAKELGAPQELKAGAEWSGSVPVTTEGLNLQVSGYRVLLFYP